MAADLPAVVISPGRDNRLEALGWLRMPLEEAGFVVSGVTYTLDERSILQDPRDVHAAAEQVSRQSAGQAAVLIGFSRGASAVLAAAATGTHACAVVAISGASDQARLVSGYRVSAPGSRAPQARRMRGAWPEEDPLLYRQASTLTHADRIHAPVLLIHGDADMVIPVDHSRWLRDAIAQAGGDVSLLEIPRAGHFFERGFDEPATSVVGAAVVGWLAGRV